jgi:signal transduction histidine kinase/CheY-like chemotaxis protein/HPt (histidine-containing phosphotransfer) domain-containing protein
MTLKKPDGVRSIIKKLWKGVTHAQVLSVFLAFALMVILSYNFMSGIERRHLLKDVDNAINNTQAHINADLQEMETTLGVIAKSIKDAIDHGDDYYKLLEYLKNTTIYLQSDERVASYISAIYGFFDIFGGVFMSGSGWIPPEGYDPQKRVWYLDAVEADGKIAVTKPYIDANTGDVTITFARRIFDDDGEPLAVVCLDVLLGKIREYAVNTTVSQNSYGILFDENFDVLAHPVPSYIGRNLDLMNDGQAIKDILLRGGVISERKAWDYNKRESVLFVKRLENGWYLAVLTYADEYYKSVRDIAVVFIILALIFSIGLSAVLLSIITSRKKAEERTQIMLDATPLCAIFWDDNLNMIECNWEAARMFDLSSKQEYMDRFFDLMPEYQSDGKLSKEKAVEMLKKAFDEGYNRFEWMHCKLDGELIPCEITLVRLQYRKEYILAGYTRDLRDVAAAKAKLYEADERTQIMLDATPLGITMWDENNNLIDFNYEAARVLGIYNKQEFFDRFSKTIPEFQPDGKKSTDRFNDFLGSAFNKGYSRTDWNHNTVNGETIPFDATAVRVMNKDDPVVIVYFRDIREINAAITKMREADECAQVLFDATPLSSFMLDKTNKIIECNQEILRLLGLYDKSRFINETFDFFPEFQPNGVKSSERIDKYVDEAFEEGYCHFEWTHKRIDGELIPTEVTMVRVKFRGDYAVAGYIRDLRELKTMIAEMRKREVAEESSKAKSDFLAKMSHEIRTPMNAILGITEIQLQDNSLPLVTREALERIYNSGDLLLGIINDILDLSKIEAGKLELVNAPYDIPSLIHDTVKLNIIRYESKPIDFKLDVSENLPSLLVGDELRIKQILNNLLSNAFKYTHEGQIELKIYCEEHKDQGNVTLVLRISDTGQGMTEEQVKKLGEKFNRFNADVNRKTEGTGLGMNITRNLIKLMDGNITVESTPGLGSTFTVFLPQDCADNKPIGQRLAENLMTLNVKSTSRMRNMQVTREFMPYGRILVVDDVETNLYVARGLMAPYGLSVDTAISGFEAVDRIRDGSIYDIIFMDHMMPRMDGIEATKIIRSFGYTAPIVALTANALAGQAEMFMSEGFDDFISKPIDIRQLNSVLNRMIRDKQPSEVIEEARKQKNTLYASGSHNIAVDSQLAEVFVRDAEKTLGVLDNICENNCRRADDIPTFIINVHAMKSALANVGEAELSDEAGKLEQAGRDNNIKLILTSLPDFIISLQRVVDKLRPAEEDESQALDKNDASVTSFFEEKILAIQSACASMNKKAAKDALNDLKRKAWTKMTKDRLSQISEHLLHSEFEEAAAIARELYFK